MHDVDHWNARLAELAKQHGIVGASLAIRADGRLIGSVTGVTSVNTEQRIDAATVFLIGSITKTWTATLVMQLVDDGLINLDDPIVSHLPAFRVTDPQVSETVTIRQLLSHSSGINGDFFHDTGRGDDALGAYVEAMAGLTQSAPQGTIYSYSNSAFNLLGHLVATLRRAPWETVLRERLIAPLGLTNTGVYPEEALLHSVARGHVFDGETIRPSDTWGAMRSAWPSGNIHSTPTDQLTFIGVHLAGGVTPDGVRILSEESAAAMRVPHIANKAEGANSSVGLAWFLANWGTETVFEHGGELSGQRAFLVALPGCGVSFCLLTNGGRAVDEFWDAVAREVTSSLPGVCKPFPLTPPEPPLPIAAQEFVGHYVCEGFDSTIVEVAPGVLENQVKMTGELAGLLPDMTFELVRYSDDVLLARFAGTDTWMPAAFFDIDGERYMQASARAFRKVP